MAKDAPDPSDRAKPKAGGEEAHEESSHLQSSIERSARLSNLAFQAPPVLPVYAIVLAASPLLGLLLDPSVDGLLLGLKLLGLPALIGGTLSAPIANALGGTLYYKRGAFLAAVGVAVVGVVLLLSIPFRALWGFPVHWALLFGYMLTASVRHTVLFTISDNRHLRTLPVSLLQPALGIPFVADAYSFSQAELLLVVLLPFAFLGPTIFFLHIFDTPMRKNFGVSFSEMFRYYLDHLTTGHLEGEELLGRFSEPIRAKVNVFAFRREDGTVKASVVVPAVHPGPIGRLGGGDLPQKIREALPFADVVLVPHGPATHDYNPVSTSEVDRIGERVREAVKSMTFAAGGTQAVTAGPKIRVTCQAFGGAEGGGALLAYTSWPDPIDDVDYGVGHAAELSARLGGMADAAFVDCHNSLVPGSGAVFPCTPRADEIIANARRAAETAAGTRVPTIRAGIAQDNRTFGRSEGVGDQGVQVLTIEAGTQRHAYIVWDGNNAVPEVTRKIGESLEGLVDGFSVMTTDNHSVNAIAGAYGPVGHLAPPDRIAATTRAAVEKALANLEPVESGFARVTVEGLRVFGHQKTVQLTASVNVMTSIVVELLVATLLLQGLAAALLFYLVGLL